MAAQRGFTLIELLVALAIAMLALLALPPLFSRALPGTELRSAGRDIVARLRAAREHAIFSGADAVFTFDAARGRYRGAGEAREGRVPTGIAVSFTTARSELVETETGRIRFFSDGGSTGGRITLASPSGSRRINVDWLTGRVTLDE